MHISMYNNNNKISQTAAPGLSIAAHSNNNVSLNTEK